VRPTVLADLLRLLGFVTLVGGAVGVLFLVGDTSNGHQAVGLLVQLLPPVFLCGGVLIALAELLRR
jgi:hypothetical protein